MSRHTLSAGEGQIIGLCFHNGRWYKWCSEVSAWAQVNDQAALTGLIVITETLAKIPFSVALSAALNAEGGSNATH